MDFVNFWTTTLKTFDLHYGNKGNVSFIRDITLEGFHNIIFVSKKPEYKIFWVDHCPIPQIKLTYRLDCGSAIDIERYGLDIKITSRPHVTFNQAVEKFSDELNYDVDPSYEKQNIFIVVQNKPLDLIRSVNLIAEELGMECVPNETGQINNLRLPSGELVTLKYCNEIVFDKNTFGLLIQFPKNEEV